MRELNGDKLEISATRVQMGSKPHLNQVFFIAIKDQIIHFKSNFLEPGIIFANILK